ncbi:MAG: hypothetical protein KDK41_07615 [Leptospiraceae bacterium]|nr:hypothetical protein [Leptospiraceae bacterium]
MSTLPFKESFQPIPRTPAEWALIGVNLAPLIGVFFFKWDAFNVILIYWTETAIIGLLGITKIGLSSGKTGFFLVPFLLFIMAGSCLAILLFWLLLPRVKTPRYLNSCNCMIQMDSLQPCHFYFPHYGC